MEKLISRADALAALFESWRPDIGTETVPVADALGRVPLCAYHARHALPVVRASAMDGVAVDSARFAASAPDTASWRPGTDYVRADTGDDFDDRFDAVVRIEDVDLLPDGGLRLREGVEVRAGMNVNGAGSRLPAGAQLNDAALPLRPEDLAALAMGGVETVEVRRRPRVAFIPTGSELIPPGAALRRGCNYDTNSLMARRMLEEMGAQCLPFPIVPDDPEQLRDALHRAMDAADIVLINGGTSKGGEDFNTRLIAAEGSLLFHGVAAAPGRPLGVAMAAGRPLINMAGPALAAFFTMEWFVRAVVCHALGTPVPRRETVRARLTSPMRGGAPLDVFSRADVVREGEGLFVTPLGRGRADEAAMLRSNAMLLTPAHTPDRAAGDEVEVTLLRPLV